MQKLVPNKVTGMVSPLGSRKAHAGWRSAGATAALQWLTSESIGKGEEKAGRTGEGHVTAPGQTQRTEKAGLTLGSRGPVRLQRRHHSGDSDIPHVAVRNRLLHPKAGWKETVKHLQPRYVSSLVAEGT